MKVLRYILLLLIIGLYSSPLISTQEDASHQSEVVGSISSVFNDLSNDYAHRLQLQYDWTDALTSYQLTTRNQDNRLRSRRNERISTSWQLRTNAHHSHAILRNHSVSISHIINEIVALSCRMPLSLPTEQISFPFHSFW